MTPLRLVLVVLVLAGCAAPAGRMQERPDAVVVASFDFAESALLGEVYAQALEGAGLPVHRELRLGPRELVLPALRQGLVDVVPEYLGSALSAVTAGAADGAGLAELRSALAEDGLRALAPSAAQNQNGLAVTRRTAERLGLRTTSDLVAAAPRLSLTGPAECPRRPHCLPGLSSAYGLVFRDFVPYDSETQRLTALEQGVVDVAVVFTTDGLLASGDLVLLVDDRGLQPAENVLPVVSGAVVERHGEQLVRILDAVSARLDSAALTFLNWRVHVGGGSVPDEARGWLVRHGLVRRS